jgi:hypothetical protein
VFEKKKKKKKGFVKKKITLKNHILEIKLKVSFSKRAFGKKHDKEISSQMNP